jgi:hypothetical protein
LAFLSPEPPQAAIKLMRAKTSNSFKLDTTDFMGKSWVICLILFEKENTSFDYLLIFKGLVATHQFMTL